MDAAGDDLWGLAGLGGRVGGGAQPPTPVAPRPPSPSFSDRLAAELAAWERPPPSEEAWRDEVVLTRPPADRPAGRSAPAGKRSRSVARPQEKAVARKARNFVFTVYADDSAPPQRVLSSRLLVEPIDGPFPFMEGDWPSFVSYACWQLERCPSSGRLHFQGYLECIGQQLYSRIQREIPGMSAAHFEVRRGTQEQARRYAMKEDTRVDGPFEFGEMKEQGRRSDLIEIKEKIDRAVPMRVVAEENFASWCRNNRSFKEYRRLVTKPRNFSPLVFLFVGPAGVGKSLVVSLLAQSGYLGSCYRVPSKHSGFWCDDYDNQPIFWVDEMDGDRMRPTFFNEVNDRYECVIPAHGNPGSQLVSRYHFFCSNYLPKYWWKKRSAMQLYQTTRRIHVIIPFFRKIFPPKGVLAGVDVYIDPSLGAVPAADYIHPFDQRHRSYAPHYHRRPGGAASLCWDCSCPDGLPTEENFAKSFCGLSK